jgi:hypothetical protein
MSLWDDTILQRFKLEILLDRIYARDLGISGRTILQFVLKEEDVRLWVEFGCLGIVSVSCEIHNQPADSIWEWEFFII